MASISIISIESHSIFLATRLICNLLAQRSEFVKLVQPRFGYSRIAFARYQLRPDLAIDPQRVTGFKESFRHDD